MAFRCDHLLTWHTTRRSPSASSKRPSKWMLLNSDPCKPTPVSLSTTAPRTPKRSRKPSNPYSTTRKSLTHTTVPFTFVWYLFTMDVIMLWSSSARRCSRLDMMFFKEVMLPLEPFPGWQNVTSLHRGLQALAWLWASLHQYGVMH
ncbi:hypothetical protein L210DRAFT_3757128 [Boletus edulis BED1]|uniref:Uncharacterized protein n=1 Tax=Boletus edulis BED1 TaxID=1328754 RepID=A0AAD4C631_BOLED|nr:hypothetical protein L210DRAFT_3757128 [Boletus edulis BED1]